MIKSILSSGNLLLSLLNDVLDLSKIEAGKLDISLQSINIELVLQEMLLLFSEKANSQGIKIRNGVQSNFPQALMLDEIRIKQVLFNLIGNAIKFTHKGYVNLKLSFNPITSNHGQLLFAIEDTGIGIPESQLDLIFDAFRQQTGQSNREYGGTGLGLAISKRLVEKMNGSITVHSTVGKGSRFEVFFPNVEISTDIEKPKEEPENTQFVVYEDASILVVDDVQSNIQIITDMLFSTGIKIHSESSGLEAIKFLSEKNKPSLILLDIKMPDMDGFEAAKQIKSLPGLADLPVIAFTAQIMKAEKIESYTYFNDYLYKPIKRSELFELLSKYIKIEKTISEAISSKENQEPLILPDINHPDLQVIIQILNDNFLPKWDSLKDSLVLFKIDEFAEELINFSHEHKFDFLLNYAQKIRDDIDSFDLESLNTNMKNFPNIIKKLEQLNKQ
jgi:CheY-like chemotaxis protein